MTQRLSTRKDDNAPYADEMDSGLTPVPSGRSGLHTSDFRASTSSPVFSSDFRVPTSVSTSDFRVPTLPDSVEPVMVISEDNMGTFLKRSFLLAIVAATLASAPDVLAGEYGSIVDGGVELSIEGVVAVWDPERPQLTFILLPFEPTPEEVELCQRGRESRIERKPIAPDTWPHWNPRGSYTIVWPDFVEGIKVGSHDKAHIHVYAYGIFEANANVNLNYMMEFQEEGVEGTLTGKVEPGEDVHLVAKGEDELTGRKITWDLDLRATVMKKLPRD